MEEDFTVKTTPVNTLALSISSNISTAREGEHVRFGASVSGNQGEVLYSWDFDGDGAGDISLERYRSGVETALKFQIISIAGDFEILFEKEEPDAKSAGVTGRYF